MATKENNPCIVAITNNKKMDGYFAMERAIEAEPPTPERLLRDKMKAEFEKQYYKKYPDRKAFR